MKQNVNATRAVLLVIDVQKGAMKDHMASLPGKIAEFIDRWKAAGGEVAFFAYRNYPGSPCERFLDWAEMQGPPATDICDELVRHVEEVFEKSYYSVFTDEFRREMNEHGWDTIVCCGIDTAACIQKTALDIFDLGKRPFVVEELCASGAGEEAHEAALVALRRAIGLRQVGSQEEALGLLANQEVCREAA